MKAKEKLEVNGRKATRKNSLHVVLRRRNINILIRDMKMITTYQIQDYIEWLKLYHPDATLVNEGKYCILVD